MCLGHVYIVLKPVGSARLTFDDGLYYELCDLMTEVCSESRLREVSKWSRGKDSYIVRPYLDIGKFPSGSGIFWSTGELREYGRSIWALLGFRGEREAGRAPPQGLVRIGLGGGAAPPPSFSSLFLSFSPTPTTWKGGILLPVGVGLPIGRAIGGPALPLLHSFIYGGGGHPIDTQVDH